MKNNKFKNFNFILGTVLLGIVFIIALIGVIGTPFDTESMDSSLKNAGVSLRHLFGCDNFGRDIFSRVCVGVRNTFIIAFVTVLSGCFAGIFIGAFTGYFGGIIDEIVMRINDVLFSFPSVLLALVIITLLGPGNTNIMIALGISFIPSFARMVRSEFIRNRELDYVKSAKLFGASDLRIMFVHIMPNVLPVLISSVLIGFNNAVLAEAGLSYLGIGVQPPEPSLGGMLSDAQSYIFSNPCHAVFPGLVIIILILGFSLISDWYSKVITE